MTIIFIRRVNYQPPRRRYYYARPRPRRVFAFFEPDYTPWTYTATVVGVAR
jgi:hypothetical protein